MATDPATGQAPPAPAAPPPGSDIPSTPDERQMAMLAHLGGILPFLGWAVPLALWANKMGQSPFIEDQAKESLNFQLNVLMLDILFAVSIFIYIGFLLFPSLVLTNALWCYLAGMAAKEGKQYRYPFNVRYIN